MYMTVNKPFASATLTLSRNRNPCPEYVMSFAGAATHCAVGATAVADNSDILLSMVGKY